METPAHQERISPPGPRPHPAPPVRIAYLSPGAPPSPFLEALQQELHALGWYEGRYIGIQAQMVGEREDVLVLEYKWEARWAEGRADQFPATVAELVQLQPDIIVTSGTPASLAAKQATSTIPIVMVAVGDPVGTGLVASLERPGGNITGLATLLPELGARRLELLKKVVPHISRVAALFNPADPVKNLEWENMQAAAQALGVQLRSYEVEMPEEFERVFAAMTREGTDALITLVDPLIILYRKQIVDFATTKHVPAMYGLREFVDTGGLMSYGVSFLDLYRRAASYVDKILRGANPGDLPVDLPQKFELAINLKAAQALGFTIPEPILSMADVVIQ